MLKNEGKLIEKPMD